MPWYRPSSWFRQPTPEADDQLHLSRRASDSTDLPMEATFAMRLPGDIREDGGRVARARGFSSLAEFMRFLLMREIKAHFSHHDRVFDESLPNASRIDRSRHDGPY